MLSKVVSSIAQIEACGPDRCTKCSEWLSMEIAWILFPSPLHPVDGFATFPFDFLTVSARSDPRRPHKFLNELCLSDFLRHWSSLRLVHLFLHNFHPPPQVSPLRICFDTELRGQPVTFSGSAFSWRLSGSSSRQVSCQQTYPSHGSRLKGIRTLPWTCE